MRWLRLAITGSATRDPLAIRHALASYVRRLESEVRRPESEATSPVVLMVMPADPQGVTYRHGDVVEVVALTEMESVPEVLEQAVQRVIERSA